MRRPALALLFLAAGPARSENLLREVRPVPDGLVLVLDRPAAHRTFSLSRPARLVVDLDDTSVDSAALDVPPMSPAIRSIRAGQFSPGPRPVARLVLDLDAQASHTLSWRENMLFIKVLPGALRDALRTGAQRPAPRRGVEPATLRSVGLEPDRVTLSLTRPVPYSAFVLREPDRLVLDLHDTRDEAADPAPALDGAVSSVSSGQNSSHPGSIARVVIYLRESAPYWMSSQGAGLTVDFRGDRAASAEAKGARQLFGGLLLDGAGAPLNGTYLLRFHSRSGGSASSAWSESQYVTARAGFFTAGLGRLRRVPAEAQITASAPPGTGWKVVAIDPTP